MSPETIHCSICSKAIRVKDFKDAMKKLRHHRKLKHPRAFAVSMEKSLRTRRLHKKK